MRIRAEGTKPEVAAAVDRLKTVFDVQETSRFYDNRGSSQLGRVYLTVASPTSGQTVHARSERADRTWAEIQQDEHRADLAADQEWGPA